jgi:hypothetical protein
VLGEEDEGDVLPLHTETVWTVSLSGLGQNLGSCWATVVH